MQLSDFPQTRYTLMEYHLFNAIPKRGRITSAGIAEARDDMGKWDVKHHRQIITTTMDRLIKKVQDNREPFRIKKEGKYPGHPHVEYWLESLPGAKRRKPLKRKNGK